MKYPSEAEIQKRRVSFYGCTQGHWTLSFGEGVCEKLEHEILRMLPSPTRKVYSRQLFTRIKQFLVKKFLRVKHLPAAIKLLMEHPRWKLIDMFLEQVKSMHRVVQENSKKSTKEQMRIINTTNHHVSGDVKTSFSFSTHATIPNTRRLKKSAMYQSEFLTTFPVFEEGYRNGDWGWVNGLAMMVVFSEVIHKFLKRKNTNTPTTITEIGQKQVIPKLKRFVISQSSKNAVVRQIAFVLSNRPGTSHRHQPLEHVEDALPEIEYHVGRGVKLQEMESYGLFIKPLVASSRDDVWGGGFYELRSINRQYLNKLSAARKVDSIRFAK